LIFEIVELLSTRGDEEDDMDWDPEDDEVDGQLWESEEDSDQEVRGGTERSTFEIGEGDPLPMHTRPIVHQEAGGNNCLSEKLFELCITFLTYMPWHLAMSHRNIIWEILRVMFLAKFS
jgi:hypothetical protein